MKSGTVTLRLSYWRNKETGLVRSFLWPPKRGKWEIIYTRRVRPSLPAPLPIGGED